MNQHQKSAIARMLSIEGIDEGWWTGIATGDQAWNDGVIIEHQGMEGGKKQKLEVGLGAGINQRPPTWFYTATIYCHS